MRVSLLVISGFVALSAYASAPTFEGQTYKDVEFIELLENLESYDGQRVTLEARALPTSHGLWLIGATEAERGTICPTFAPGGSIEIKWNREDGHLSREKSPLVQVYGTANYTPPPPPGPDGKDPIIVSSDCGENALLGTTLVRIDE